MKNVSDLKNLEKELQCHDWWYMMSDDHRVYRNGLSHMSLILELIKRVPKTKAQKLWEKYSPKKDKFHTSDPFPFPNSLHTKEK